MNEYDSNRILDLAKTVGYMPTQNILDTDCCMVNTCHIREKATEKVFHDIGRVKKEFSLNEFSISVTSKYKIILKNIRLVDRLSKKHTYTFLYPFND